MIDDNWELINGPDAHQIEVLNYSNQINVIVTLVRFVMHHGGGLGSGCPNWPNAEALCELHRVGTLFLLARPGEFRDSHVNLQKPDGTVVYDPPQHTEVPKHVEDFVAHLGKVWVTSTAIEIASYCLWRINWIHPFKNGNGRCARAFMYACILLKYGEYELPGSPTILDLISTTKPDFEKALAVADKAYKETGEADLSEMNKYVERLLIQQLRTIPENEQ